MSMGQKSDQGIRLLGGSCINAVFLAKESEVSLPKMLMCPGIHRNWISKPLWLRDNKRFLIWKIRGFGSDLNTLDERDCSQESESVAMRNLLGCKV